MKILAISIFILVSLTGIRTAYADPGSILPHTNTSISTAVDGCTPSGVLIDLSKISAADYGHYGLTRDTNCIEKLTFKQYLQLFLDQNFWLIMFFALLMIIASGLQYMLSGFAADNVKQARTRIVGILSGVVFYLLIRLIINQLTPNVNLTLFQVTPSQTIAAQRTILYG